MKRKTRCEKRLEERVEDDGSRGCEKRKKRGKDERE